MQKSLHTSVCVISITILQFIGYSAHAATITYDGSQIIGLSWQPQGIAWRDPLVTKNFDIDGDNILGTAGYYLAGTGLVNAQQFTPSNFDTSVMTFSPVSWLSVATSAPQVNYQGNFSFREFQDPNNPSTKLNVGYMGRAYSDTLTVGNFYSLYDFTVGSGIPGNFTITIALHPEFNGNAGLEELPSSLQLVQTVGGSGSATSGSYGTFTDFDAAFVTFTVTGANVGDVFQLQGQAADTQLLLINGLMIDAIPEPSTSLLLLGGLSAVVWLRRRSRVTR